MTEAFRQTIERRLEAIDAKLDRLDEAIRGNPGNGSKPGILVRLDRLEQDAKRQSRLIWLIIGPASWRGCRGLWREVDA